MPRSPDANGYFTKGVLALTADPDYDKYYGQGPSYVVLNGWARPLGVDPLRPGRSINLLGTQNTPYYLHNWECLSPCASVTLHQKQVSQHYTCVLSFFLFFANHLSSALFHQLLYLSDDGFASLLDAEGNVSEDTLISQQWRALLHRMLSKGTEVELSPTSFTFYVPLQVDLSPVSLCLTGEDVWLSFMRIAGRKEEFLFGIIEGSNDFVLCED